MDESFIVVSIISGLFGILGLQLLTHNWFKKERFKLEAHNLKKENDIRLKKLARDLGLDTKQGGGPPAALGGDIGGLLGLAKNLSKDQIADIIDIVAGGGGGGGEEPGDEAQGDVVNSLIDGFMQTDTGKNLVNKVIQGGLKGVAQGQQETGSQV